MKHSAIRSILRSLAFSLALVGPAFITSFVLSSLDPGLDGMAVRRIAEIVGQLPDISRDRGPTIIALGPSDVEVNFSAEQIQTALEKRNYTAHIYNFGVRLMGAESLRGLCEALANSFARREKIEVSIIRFMPMFYTRTSRRNLEHSTYDFLSQIYDGTFLAHKLLERPTQSIEILFSKYIRLAGKQDYCSRAFSRFLNASATSIRPKTLDWTPLSALWTDPNYFGELDVPWNKKRRGDSQFDEAPQVIESYVEANKEVICRQSAAFHQITYGYLDLDMDDQSLAEFQKAVESLKRISKHVIVLYVPDYFCPGVPPRSAAAEKRLRAVLNWEKNNLTGVEFLDYSDKITNDPADHIDVAHFTLKGRERFNLLMADDILRVVNNDEAN